jgi:peptidoglycan L-alanyl-D-glutamate endopeptidase CwlK
MPTFSETSSARLATCHPALQKLMWQIVRDMDIAILEGWRSPEKQLEYYEQGKSKVLKSKHNHMEVLSGVRQPWALAVDIAPYPINFGSTPKEILRQHIDTKMTAATMATLEKKFIQASQAVARFYYLAGMVKERARNLNISIRWGGDWDGDYRFFDQTFYDLVHFELVDYEDRPLDDGSYTS